MSRPRSFRCYIATSRCPTAFLLFTRFLVARSRRAIPSSLALRVFLRAFRLPLLPGLSTATFARVRCEECDTPRFTTRTREMRKRGGGVRPRGRPRRRGILEKGDVQRLEDREKEWGRDYWLTRHRLYGEGGGGKVWNTLAEDFHREPCRGWTSLIPRVSFKSRFRGKLPVLRDKIARSFSLPPSQSDKVSKKARRRGIE